MEKYLYFTEKVVRTETVSTSNAASNGIQVFRISNSANSGADGKFLTVSHFTTPIFTNGAIVIDLTVHANQDFGSHYGSPAASSTVRIHPSALSYDGTQDITVKNKTEDPVYGITMSATGNQNVVVVSQVKPIYTGDGIVLPLSSYVGAVASAANKTVLKFKPHTNDGEAPADNSGSSANVDQIELTHADNSFHIICNMLRDIAGDNRAQSGMITFADDYEEVYYNNNPAGITDCNITFDTAN